MVKKKLDQVVYEDIIEKIETGQLLEKEHVTEQGIADDLQVSRTPVRKAFDRLVYENYLESIENVGVRVKAQPLSSRDFQERVDFIERLVNHYLFDLEKTEIEFNVDELEECLEAMRETVTDEAYAFQNEELKYWQALVVYSKNNYTNRHILKAMRELMFDDSEIHKIIQDSRSLIMEHLTELTRVLAKGAYELARREIRILMNQLKLNVIENGQDYN